MLPFLLAEKETYFTFPVLLYQFKKETVSLCDLDHV